MEIEVIVRRGTGRVQSRTIQLNQEIALTGTAYNLHSPNCPLGQKADKRRALPPVKWHSHGRKR